MYKKTGGASREYGINFAVCAGLFATGVLLQSVAGKTDLRALAFPVNCLAGGGFLLLLSSLFFWKHRNSFVRWTAGFPASVSAIVSLTFLTVVMGLTRQHASGTEVTDWVGRLGFSQMISSWPFALLTGWFLTVLWLVILKRLHRFMRRDIPFLFSHLGLFLAMAGAVLGSADRQQLEMILSTGRSEWKGTDERGEAAELPFTVQLDRLIAEPERYASQVTLHTRSGKQVEAWVEVNKPFRIVGWDIYQMGYDYGAEKGGEISVFECVRDPWLPVVYTGIWMLLAGAVCLFGISRWKTVFVIVAVFIGIYFFRPEMHSKALPPILQSPWFVPHVLAYMLAYALLGGAVLVAVYLLWVKKGGITSRKMKLCDGLVSAGCAFLTAGLLFGALWAKEAWGHYWSWDPKETWAAATWLAFLAYMHFQKHRTASRRLALYLLLISFLLLQMCWYGVNYLPSAQGSLHTYS